MRILEDINTDEWGPEELDACLNFLYGDFRAHFANILALDAHGTHKPKTQYLEENEEC